MYGGLSLSHMCSTFKDFCISTLLALRSRSILQSNPNIIFLPSEARGVLLKSVCAEHSVIFAFPKELGRKLQVVLIKVADTFQLCHKTYSTRRFSSKSNRFPRAKPWRIDQSSAMDLWSTMGLSNEKGDFRFSTASFKTLYCPVVTSNSTLFTVPPRALW